MKRVNNSAANRAQQSKCASKVLTIKSKTLSTTFVNSLLAKVLKSGSEARSLAQLNHCGLVMRRVRRYSDVARMLPGTGSVGVANTNTVTLTFLQNSYLASTLPAHRAVCAPSTTPGEYGIRILQSDCRKPVGNQSDISDGNKESTKYGKTHRRRKTIGGIPSMGLCVEELDCTDEADKEIQEIFAQASKRRTVCSHIFCVKVQVCFRFVSFVWSYPN